ncbi:3-keto-5-aminohexanoate cleavage protein [Sporomusa malonica]|uniref:Uncharacterized conserved protein, DUF849 family n=1 Tax=Sporomusa malonica TaxID=112901 RepID=A0A1W2F5W5_9FIRM|nr:3-keto-5-aminohexanoate cleavage protein [Sporomusa malonica]SMD17313.1 Uncharacterized conserved protein, DUF849 family [Sporomusa malonica]
MVSKVVITAAITGAIHTPSMSCYLPSSPATIIEDAVKAHEAGAAVVHIHARSPNNGKPTSDLGLMREIAAGIKQRCDAIICMTTGGAQELATEERLAPVAELKPEIASCCAGTMNFNFSDVACSIKNPKFDWEIPYLKESQNFAFTNTFEDLSHYILTMNKAESVPEYEIYDVGMINNISYFYKRWLAKRPIYLQFILGVTGGIPATIDNLTYLVKTAREEFGDFIWSCAAKDNSQFLLGPAAIAMGGNVRVGLEDNLYIKPNVLAKSSAEQVGKMRQITELMGGEVASANDVRIMLGLKGRSNVNY